MRDHDAGIRTDAYPCHKTPWKAGKATIEFPRVSIAYMRGDTPLVLCQTQWTTCEGDPQAGQTPGEFTLASRVEVVQGYTVLETPAV